jgi:hypothetical protein
MITVVMLRAGNGTTSFRTQKVEARLMSGVLAAYVSMRVGREIDRIPTLRSLPLSFLAGSLLLRGMLLPRGRPVPYNGVPTRTCMFEPCYFGSTCAPPLGACEKVDNTRW